MSFVWRDAARDRRREIHFPPLIVICVSSDPPTFPGCPELLACRRPICRCDRVCMVFSSLSRARYNAVINSLEFWPCRFLFSAGGGKGAAERVSESEHDDFGDGDPFDEQENAIGAEDA